LIEAYPQAAKEKDVNGCLPLHYACDSDFDRPRNQDFVSELFKIYPEATQTIDNKQELPLHYMQQYFCLFSENSFGYGEDSFDIQIEKPLVESYPDVLLQSDGENQLVLCELARFRCPLRQVWHTAGRLCTNAFICATPQSMQPLRELTYELEDLVKNVTGLPLDRPRKGDMQDGELAGIILHYSFEALLQANHGLDSKSNLPLSCNLVMPCLPVDNYISTVKTTLLHKLAYCSKFCAQHHHERTLDLYVSRQSANFLQAENYGNLPLHLVCFAPPPLILGEYERGFREKTKASLVKTFLTPCMEAASKTNHFGKTPLDILMETYSELYELNIDSWHGVELLVEANPTEQTNSLLKRKCSFSC